ncbi:DUF805 domain-containing protein [Rhodobacterales bacterium HKCCSP123]|nr:DUF805 domain-containing protein [Rhodobacterales bacterium HKCCSP123]
MGPIKAVASCYMKMLNFSGRARRAEYWWFALFLVLAGVAVQVALAMNVMSDADFAAAMTSPGAAQTWIKQNPEALHLAGYALAGYIVLGWLPQLTVTVRRLHDTNRSGWYIFMPFLAYLAAVGGAILLTMTMAGNGAQLGVIGVMIIPMVASIRFLIVLCLPGTRGNNRFGPDPVPNRKRRAPAHPAFAPQLPADERAQMAAERQSEIRAYYQTHVLGSIQKA